MCHTLFGSKSLIMLLSCLLNLVLSRTELECENDTCTFTGSGELTKDFFLNETFERPTKVVIGGDIYAISVGAFKLFGSIKEVVINSSKLVELNSSVFESCVNLVSITNPSKSIKSIGNYTFKNCFSLVYIDFLEQINNIGEGSFFGCRSLGLSKISFDIKAKSFYKALKTDFLSIENDGKIGINGFYKAGISKDVIISSNEVGDGAFLEISSLETLEFTGDLKSIGKNSFAFTGIKCISIPENVNIGNYAFSNNNKLSKVELKNGVILGENPFFNSTNIISFESKSDNYRFNDMLLIGDKKIISAHIFNNSNITIPSEVDEFGSESFTFTKIKRMTYNSSKYVFGDHVFYGATVESIAFQNGVSDELAKYSSMLPGLSYVVYCGEYNENYDKEYFSKSINVSVPNDFKGDTFYGATVNHDEVECSSATNTRHVISAADIVMISVSGFSLILAVIAVVYILVRKRRTDDTHSELLLPEYGQSIYR